MHPPGGDELMARIDHWHTDPDGGRHVVEGRLPICDDAAELSALAGLGWAMIARTLREWRVPTRRDLPHTYQGQKSCRLAPVDDLPHLGATCTTAGSWRLLAGCKAWR
jgi:hypothetical protein